MTYVYIAIMVLLYTFQSVFCKMFGKAYPGNEKLSSLVYSVFYGIIVALATFAFAGFSFLPTKWSIILGVANGLVLAAYNAMLIKASSSGPFSIAMIFNLAGGIIVPMVWSILYSGTEYNVWQYAAIFVMIISFVFLNTEKKNKQNADEQKITPQFILYSLLLALINGTYSALLDTQKILTSHMENKEMIIVTFATSAVAALLVLVFRAKGEQLKQSFKQTPKSVGYLLIASLSAATAVNLLMYLLGITKSAILFASNCGGVMLVSVAWSTIFFKEKLTVNKIIGLVLALSAIIALAILQG